MTNISPFDEYVQIYDKNVLIETQSFFCVFNLDARTFSKIRKTLIFNI